MTDFEVKLEMTKTGGVCQQILDSRKGEMVGLMSSTISEDEEHAVGVALDGDGVEITPPVIGESSILSKSITAGGVVDIREEMARITDMEGVGTGIDFYETYDDFVLVHTHPSGDPSPSSNDMRFLFSLAETLTFANSSTGSLGSSLPVLTGLMALSHQQGSLIMTGFTIRDDFTERGWAEYLDDEASSLKLGALSTDLIDRGSSTSEDKRQQAFENLIEMATEGWKGMPPILNGCHGEVEVGDIQ